ncbi:MAG: anti-sigma factor [Chloroflexota bacterium]
MTPMTPMDHADAHERIVDLSLEPDRLIQLARELAGVDRSTAADLSGDPFLDHVAGCDTCREEVGAWYGAHALVHEALVDPAGPVLLADIGDGEPITAPAPLRESVLARIRTDLAAEVPLGRVREPRSGLGIRTRPSLRRLLPLVAALSILVVVGGLILDGNARLGRAESDVVALEAMSATLDRVLEDPDHWVVGLRGVDGQSRGSVSWSTRDLVVLTTALAPPPEGQVYRCWLEKDGHRSGVGRMVFAGGTSFWVGTLGAWGSTSFGPGSTFGISLEPVSGSEGNPAILSAPLGG